MSKQTDLTASLSDNDLAAALGFHTTLSEPLIPQDAGNDQQAEQGQTADESPQTKQDASKDNSMGGGTKHDNYQDKEIADIRAQLMELMQQETNETQNEQEDQDTGTPQ